MKKSKNRSPVSAVCSALGTLILIILIIVCIPLTVPKFLGYQLYTVVTGSMEPEIPVGSLVVIKESDPKDAQPEEVVAFYGVRDSEAIVTHRVVENRVIMGQLITKGDANATNDMNPVPYDNFIGTVKWSVPGVGIVAQVFTSFEGKMAAGGMIGIALVLHAVSMLIDGSGPDEEAPVKKKRK